MASGKDNNIATIKKYANRRLYNTQISTYITLEDLYEMVQRNEDFIVVDAKTGADLTKQTLTQIIVEHEARGNNLLPSEFLKQIIRSYGQNVDVLLPHYLDNSMEYFSKHKEDIQKTFQNSQLSKITEFNMELIDEAAKKNMDLFKQSMDLLGNLYYKNDDNK